MGVDLTMKTGAFRWDTAHFAHPVPTSHSARPRPPYAKHARDVRSAARTETPSRSGPTIHNQRLHDHEIRAPTVPATTMNTRNRSTAAVIAQLGPARPGLQRERAAIPSTARSSSASVL